MSLNKLEFVRFVLNGVVATTIHFAILSFNIHILDFSSAGFANFIAAVFGISASFVGNRYFVFKTLNNEVTKQAVKFIALYGIISIFHGLVLFVWTDIHEQNYQIGFLIATIIQFILSFIGNKVFVFR